MARASTRDLVLTGLFAALTAAGAFLRLPLEPVPFTLQPLVVFLAGAVLAPAVALSSQLVYLALGLLGLPVFANGGGPAYVLQPTFGFLVGFAAAAWVAAWIGKGGTGRGRTLLGLVAGLTALYACGVLGLFLNLAVVQGKAQVFRKVVWGLGGFLVFDAIKVAAAAALAPALRRAVGADTANR
ncbi:MAG: biotin transporter BioY [Deltaproteobacteria bacterium]|nr:biotin transporter BioY [Deltaproteobacteria bacterium]